MSMAPILLLIASAGKYFCLNLSFLSHSSSVSGFGQAHIFASGKSIHTAFQSELERWNGSVFALSLATNIVVTTLIGCRIW